MERFQAPRPKGEDEGEGGCYFRGRRERSLSQNPRGDRICSLPTACSSCGSRSPVTKTSAPDATAAPRIGRSSRSAGLMPGKGAVLATTEFCSGSRTYSSAASRGTPNFAQRLPNLVEHLLRCLQVVGRQDLAQNVGAQPACGHSADQYVRIGEDLHETRSNTSLSVRKPSALANGIIHWRSDPNWLMRSCRCCASRPISL
jgi:hypothetical protein